MSAITDLLASGLAMLEGIATVTVRKVNADTGATVATKTGVTAYRKGGALEEIDGPTFRLCQWRLILPTGGFGFEVEPLSALVIEADGTTWQVKDAAKAVYDTQRICQCAMVTPG